MRTLATTVYKTLPAQMLSEKIKKQEQWQKKQMDRLEQIGRIQFLDNLKLLENYEMLKGKFIPTHYFETGEYNDMLSQLSQDFQLPNYLRHYDIISPIINAMSGEMQEHPDNFRIRRFDEGFSNVFIREKTRLLMLYLQEEIQTEINKALVEQGYDPTGESVDFKDDEDRQQYLQVISQKKQELTPPEIQTYMHVKWSDIGEIFGQHQLDKDKEHFNLKYKEKIEFEDLLISARCWRHFFVNSNGHQQETWNPVTTFYHKSPDVEYPEDGDYIGQQFFLTPSDIVNRFGEYMSAEQIKMFDQDDSEFTRKGLKKGESVLSGDDGAVDGYGIPYGTLAPFMNYPDYRMQVEGLGFDPMLPIPSVDDNFWSNLATGRYSLDINGYVRCTMAYFKSKKKQGYYCYFDTELEMIRNIIVDENFVIPEEVTVYSNKNWKENKDIPDTLTWTWVDEVYQGYKFSIGGTRLEKDLYLEVRPCDLQIDNPYIPGTKKLPVIGCLNNSRNTHPVPLVDLIKPDQIGHNVAMNQLYQIMEREVGRFMILDVNILPRFKNWGGEQGYEKFINVARALGITIADTSPQNTKGANAGGQLPKMIDLDESSRMASRMNIANAFEQNAKRRVGVSDQRLGDIGRGETATGINQGISKSYTQTRSYFTGFFDYKRRCLAFNLDAALFVQQNNPNIQLSYTNTDLTRAFFSLNGQENLQGVKLSVYVVNSQEAIRQTELIRNLFMNNNNTDASPVDLVTMITSNSPAEMKAQLAKSYADTQQRMQEEQSLKRESLQLQDQAAKRNEEWEREKFYAKLDSEEQQAYIKTFALQKNNLQDQDNNSIPDILEYDKLNAKATKDIRDNDLQRERNRIAQEQIESNNRNVDKNIRLQEKKLRQEERIKNKELSHRKGGK
jgi:hypothetical protein